MTIVLTRNPGLLRRLWWWLRGWRQAVVSVGHTRIEEHYYRRGTWGDERLTVIYPWGACDDRN